MTRPSMRLRWDGMLLRFGDKAIAHFTHGADGNGLFMRGYVGNRCIADREYTERAVKHAVRRYVLDQMQRECRRAGRKR